MKNVKRHLDITRRNSEWYLQKPKVKKQIKEKSDDSKS